MSKASCPLDEKHITDIENLLALLLILPSTFYLLGSIYPPSTLSLLFPRPAPPPLRVDSEEGRAYTAKLEQELQNLPIVKEMRAMTVKPDGSEGEWYETREQYFCPFCSMYLLARMDRSHGQVSSPSFTHVLRPTGSIHVRPSAVSVCQKQRIIRHHRIARRKKHVWA